LFIIIMSYLILGEKITLKTALAGLFVFIGILILTL